MATLLDAIFRGEMLLEEVMKPRGITARQLAADIDVSPSRLGERGHGTRPITADGALRLGLFFGMEPRFWLKLQTEYDIRKRNTTSELQHEPCMTKSPPPNPCAHQEKTA